MQPQSRYYIATGAQENYYTLRFTFDEITYERDATGNAHASGTITRDYHVRNLSIDRTAAIAKAREITGKDLTAEFDVLPMGEKRPVDWSILQGGRHQGSSIHELAESDPKYLLWLCENCEHSASYAKTVELIRSLSALAPAFEAKATAEAAAEQARLKRASDLERYAELIADGRGGFCDSIADDIRRGSQLRGRGLDLALDILAKNISGKRNGCKAWQAAWEDVWARFDACYTAYGTNHPAA